MHILIGGHYACSTKKVELASFFIFGAALYEFSEDLGRSRHTCAIVGHGTLARIRNHLLPSIKNIFSNNDIDIIVINAMRWTLNDIKYEKSLFEAPLFINFAEEYMYNMSLIIQEVIIMSPSSIIMLQKLPYKIHHSYAVHAVNKLLDILSIQHNIGILYTPTYYTPLLYIHTHIIPTLYTLFVSYTLCPLMRTYLGIFDVDNMCNGYTGGNVLADDIHPTYSVSVNFVNLLVDIANINRLSYL